MKQRSILKVVLLALAVAVAIVGLVLRFLHKDEAMVVFWIGTGMYIGTLIYSGLTAPTRNRK